ncbi:nucleotidyl transferase AbiEii/AbiGii toxin family protein [Jiangella alba]|uniref:Nucleotidyl transferase AbiEii toxin, Type IV TA system n=1 Tax=Jiangella alba TaxID=561176 RepID=A0A1H5PP77_9ACTN|nr:nucleotidyl transferase AbiEii/AbiGii toxin family protein [Jiangella alba]SEF15565.1 Nucleotidyl transferase AbiEii toxin, Type IV TA system [Jiangella alba]
MIPPTVVTSWSLTHSWPTPAQVEQDLLLSRAICEIAADPYLGDELVFRGGTAFHKLHMGAAYRYSEDLDYVRATGGGIRDLTHALTELGHSLGYEVRTRITQHPKVHWRTTSADGIPLRIKIEVNTHERSPAIPHVRRRHRVESAWWAGAADVLTFQTSELVATKIRALYQRSKGRDLFDLWLALVELEIPPTEILEAFGPYRPDSFTSARAIANLRGKVADNSFRSDLGPLVAQIPDGYGIDTAAELIIDQLLSHID